MKKLLLVLLVVTLASFLFVGCIPVTPSEGEGEGETEVGICPTVSITSQVAVGGKKYIKGGEQTVTITFAVPTEPVSAFVAANLKGNPDGVPDGATEIVLYTADGGLTYTGEVEFAGTCEEGYIYILTCESCLPCKEAYTVDTLPPKAQVEICIEDPACDGCILTFSSTSTDPDCEEGEECCGDDCSGLASWSLDLYDQYPFEDCCEIPCETPIASYSGVCPIDVTTAALGSPDSETLFALVTLVDHVGNKTKMLAEIEFNPDTCDEIILTTYGPETGFHPNEGACGDDIFVDELEECVDTPDFVVCSEADAS